MTNSGRETGLHNIPYDGNIEAHIDEVRANQLMINETPDVSRNLTAIIQRMTDAGVEGLEYVLPSASGFMAKCANPYQAYDAAYGNGAMAKPAAKNDVVVPFKPFSSISLNAKFGDVAQNDNGVSRAPAVHSAFDRARIAPALGGMSFEAQVLIAA